MRRHKLYYIFFFVAIFYSAVFAQADPDTAKRVSIDRFSADAGHLFVRDVNNNLPGPNQPINFDMEPFISKGLGPNGEHISYYNFDVQLTEPAPIFVLFREGEEMPVSGQLNIVDDVPGDSDYNDFWEVQKVTVPSNYIANTVTSYQAIVDSGYPVEETNMLVNCPIVPDSSTAVLRLNGESSELTEGWYNNMIIYYFNFSEKSLVTNQSDMVPLSPIFVSFNINPNEANGGPPSGFKVDTATGRNHNVTATLPEDDAYSPLWMVNIYDNADFDKVHDLASAQSANILVNGAANVNCPIVSLTKAVSPDTVSKVSIDRFSADAGHLFVRDSTNMLPAPNAPIDFDKPPFITKGFGPNGELIAYYNFDVQPTEPAPIYVLFREGDSMPVAGQLNIVDDVPGDSDYNDFWEVQKVTVPKDYLPNSVTSLQEIMDENYNIEETNIIVNCPIVPDGSVARKRWNGSDFGLTRGWYNHQVVYYFNFAEKDIMTNNMDMIDSSPIYVSFNINPGDANGGPPSGFKTDTITNRAHNVAATIPTDANYSPLWSVNIYDNADFEMVHDLTSAQSANILATNAALVNCPIVAQYVKIDRFSADAGHLFIRDTTNNLPGPNEPVNFDEEPLISKGLGPDGEHISYYNFDVQPTEPAPIYVLVNSMTLSPINEQHNIIDVIPGDTSYNDFWEVQTVMVPGDYVPNSITSYKQLVDSGYTINETTMLVNCPVVPEGSTAKMRLNGESAGLTWGWYKGKIVYYFNFSEKALMTNQNDMVPISPIFVSFNINPGMPGGGPPSGFMTEDSTGRTHNVTATLPDDETYSPLWMVNIYDNADFEKVHDLTSAQSANILVNGAANVNCPIVSIEPVTAVDDNNNSSIPLSYSLKQNYPNPFNPSTQIKFSVIKNERVSLKVYDILGKEVATLVNDIKPAGNYSVTFDAKNLASGVYVYQIKAGNFIKSNKMVLLK